MLYVVIFVSSSLLRQDFDGSTVGNAVVQGLLSSPLSKVSWTERPSSDFSGGAAEVADLVVDQKAWIAVVGMPSFLFLSSIEAHRKRS